MGCTLFKSSFWLLCEKLTIGGNSGSKVASYKSIALCRRHVVEAGARESAGSGGVQWVGPRIELGGALLGGSGEGLWGTLEPNGWDLEAVFGYALPPPRPFAAVGTSFLHCSFSLSNHNLLSLTFPKGRRFTPEGLNLPRVGAHTSACPSATDTVCQVAQPGSVCAFLKQCAQMLHHILLFCLLIQD